VDQLQSGVLSLIGIGKADMEVLEILYKALDFVVQVSAKSKSFNAMYSTFLFHLGRIITVLEM
jgi:hypothetical protein